MAAAVSYSIVHRVVHWLVVVLVVFNLLLPDKMEDWSRTIARGGAATADQIASANFHAYAGIAILVLTLCRLVLRLTVKVPPLPSAEPAMFRVAAKLAHVALYLLTIALPLSGIGAYHFGNEQAGEVHAGPLKLLL